MNWNLDAIGGEDAKRMLNILSPDPRVIEQNLALKQAQKRHEIDIACISAGVRGVNWTNGIVNAKEAMVHSIDLSMRDDHVRKLIINLAEDLEKIEEDMSFVRSLLIKVGAI